MWRSESGRSRRTVLAVMVPQGIGPCNAVLSTLDGLAAKMRRHPRDALDRLSDAIAGYVVMSPGAQLTGDDAATLVLELLQYFGDGSIQVVVGYVGRHATGCLWIAHQGWWHAAGGVF